MRKNSGNIFLVLLASAFVVSVGIAGYFYWSSKPMIPTNTPTIIKNTLLPTSTPNNENLTPEEAKKSLPLPNQITNWKTYINTKYKYSVKYPADWEAIEAKTSQSRGPILQKDEFQKIAFWENCQTCWQGSFEISVKPASGQSLDQWSKDFHAPLAADPSTDLAKFVENTQVANQPAKKYSIFQFDHQESLIVTIFENQLYFFSFSGENPNDPNITVHDKIYQNILSTFKFL